MCITSDSAQTPPPAGAPRFPLHYDQDKGQWDRPDFDTPIADTRLGDLPAPANAGYPLPAGSNSGEDTRAANYGEHTGRGYLFDWAHGQLQPASNDVAGNIPSQLDTFQTNVQNAKYHFLTNIAKLDGGPSPWQGATRNAAWAAINDSFKILDTLAKAAGNLSITSDAFSRTMSASKTAFSDEHYNREQEGIRGFPQARDQIVQTFDTFARNFIQGTYNANINKIAANVPNFNIAAIAQIAGANPGPGAGGTPNLGGGGGTPNLGGGGGTPNLGGGGGPGAGGGMPNIPMPNVPADPNLAALANNPTTSQNPITSTTSPNTSATTTSPPGADTSALQGLGQAAMPLGQAAQSLASPLQSAMGAAQQAGNRGGVPNAANSLGKLPLQEGTLAKGLSKGGAGGIGAGAAGAAIANKPAAGAPSTAASTADRTVAAASRAGISSAAGAAAGAPGAGAPGSGQQGANAQGTQHQASKALRHKKNGEELIGDTEAVVPVLGEPAHPEAGKQGEPTSADSNTIQRHEDRPRHTSPAPVPVFPQPGR